jgi:hypothetical protein
MSPINLWAAEGFVASMPAWSALHALIDHLLRSRQSPATEALGCVADRAATGVMIL